MPIRFVFRLGSSSESDAIQAVARLEHERIGGAVIGIGYLGKVVSLRETHDDVAFMGVQRVAHEARRTGIPGVGNLFIKLLREEFRELVFEPFPSLVRERQVSRVGADTKDMRIDKLK